MIRIGVAGLGYWGPNLIRCFSDIAGCRVTAICDQNQGALQRIGEKYPQAKGFDDFNQMLESGLIDATVIATPTMTHFPLAMQALERGIHVLVEKPLAETAEQCREMIATAKENSCVLLVGHVFLYASAVLKLKELIVSNELGRISYISSRRLNLGPIRKDVSALFDLATHDISMMLYLLDSRPQRVTCSGIDLVHPEIHDVCNLTMHFHDKQMGMAHVSWLDPRKERVLTVVGDKKMAIYDDLDSEKIKIYDKGIIAPPSTGDFAEFQISFRYGGSYCPFIQEREPLKTECSEFIRCIQQAAEPLTDGRNGMAVVEVLEAANRSLQLGGVPIDLPMDDLEAVSSDMKSRSIR